MSRLEGKSFALVGVNSDRDREELKDVLADERITWRSFWNGGSTNGPIARQWKVQGWPTLVLIDAKGVIRNKWAGSPGNAPLDAAIDRLIADAERN